MKITRLAALATLLAGPALAQTANQTLTGLYGYPGQTPTAAGIVPSVFSNDTDTSGFGSDTLGTGVTAAGTTQATATVLLAKTNVITTCPGSAGVQLPTVTRYVPIVVVNRSGAACLVYPTVGATAESAPGTVAALNAGVSQANNTTVTYRPVSPTAWDQ